MAFSSEDQQLITALAKQHNISEDAVRALWHAVEAGNGTAAQFNHPELGGMGQWMAGGMVMVGDFNKAYLQGTVTQICTAIANHLKNRMVANQYAAQSSQSQSQWSNPGGMVPPTVAPVQMTPAGGERTQTPSQGGGMLSAIGKKLFGKGEEKPSSSATGSRPAADPATAPSTMYRSVNWWPTELGAPNSTGSQNEMHYAYFAVPQRLALRLNNHVTIYDTGAHQINGVSQQQGATKSLTFRSQLGDISTAQLKKVVEYQL